jgi:acetyl-CoA carboxylase biotin carboxylase subunit
MRLMGNKTEARSLLLKSGVPIVPGSHGPLRSVDHALEEARRIGFPLMLKAAAGGGGKGMRLVEEEKRLAPAFEAAGSEALRAFGNPSVYIEKYITRPRHIEIQVLADRRGNAISLGERECSIQRRHQKVLEESPSAVVDEGLRQRMGAAALGVVRSANYENAGTVEFLVGEDKSFYFLEMNTRLQVEHPVTEAVTGLDLVHEQIRIASGERLSLRQEDVRLRGWAMECRIFAEDPDRNFFPSPGIIRRLTEPSGPGVRVDSGVYEGWEVPVHYDPLIAKLVVSGADRSEAIARMRRAIKEYRIQGIRTNLGFFAELLEDDEFKAGRISTQFIEEFFRRRPKKPEPATGFVRAAAVAAALACCDQARSPEATGTSISPWRLSLRNASRFRSWREKAS